MRRPLEVAFVVQGEGRGHMTQALALSRFLREAGHRVSLVLVGRSPYRSVPGYFRDAIGAEVVEFDAPVQVPGRDRRGVSGLATVQDALRRLPAFARGARLIHERTSRVDVVVNFLDLVAAVSRAVFDTPVPAVAVAHNHLFAHPAVRQGSGLPGRGLARRAVRAWIGGTAMRTRSRVALAFEPLPAAGGIDVLPPLLRPEVDGLVPSDGGYLLAYALNPGYADTLAAWQARRPEVEVHCFVEGGGRALRGRASPGFTAHPLDARTFLEHLAGCRAYVGSAGFESICEAHHLGKPVLAVPTEGQLEQEWNAWDAERCGVARAGSYADLDAFWDGPPRPSAERVAAFRAWVRRAPELHVTVVERAAAAVR